MAKICKSCYGQAIDQAAVCQYCGGREFIPAEENQTTAPTADMNPMNGQYQQAPQYQQTQPQQGWQPPVLPQEQKKSKRKTIVVVSVFAAIFVIFLVIAGVFGMQLLRDEGYGYYAPEVDINNDSGLAYTKGAFADGVYVNEWADIRFVLPEGYYEADASYYASYENDVTDCGGYFFSEFDEDFISFAFEKLPSYPVYSETAYLDVLVNTVTDVDDVAVTVNDEYSTKEIGGYTYYVLEYTMSVADISFPAYICVRKLDSYMICISWSGLYSESFGEILSHITSAE